MTISTSRGRAASRILLPIPRDRFVLRLFLLVLWLTVFGLACGLLLRAGLGADPWDVFHQGLSRTCGLQVGTWTILVGVGCLLLWIPLRQRVGLGTVLNVILIGLSINATLALIPAQHGLSTRIPMLAAAILLYAFATGGYIGAGMGPGPRDGLMTAIAARGRSLRLVRTGIELTVLLLGWLLGGTVGVGTLVFAATIGPLVHWTIPLLTIGARPGADKGHPTPENVVVDTGFEPVTPAV